MSLYTDGSLRASTWVILLRAACLLALGTSVALLLDYTQPSSDFCSQGSGCTTIRNSGLGYIPIGVGELPVPVPGVLGFAFLYASTLLGSGQMRERVAAPLAYFAAVAALALIGLQAYLGAFCSLCMIVDTSALVCATAAFFLRGGGWEESHREESSRDTLMDPLELMSEGQRVKGVWRDDSQIYEAPNSLVQPAPEDPLRLKLSAWISLAVLAAVAPLGFSGLVKTSEVPGVIRGLYEPNTITVLEFFDFQCPHCRRLSPRLKALVDQNPEFSLKYGYTPLPSHGHAKDAARVAICAGEQGRESVVAAALFQDGDLTLPHITEVASGLVPDSAQLAACLASKRPDERIASDTAALKAAGFEGLPTTYVGGIRILGAQDDSAFEDALRRVKSGDDTGGLNPWAYWVGVLLVLAALVLLGRVEKGDRRSIPG